MIVKYDTNRFKYPIGYSVDPAAKWDKDKHRIRSGMDKDKINVVLNDYESHFIKIFDRSLTPGQLKEKMDEFRKLVAIPKVPKPGKKTFYEIFQEAIDAKKKEESKANFAALKKRMITQWPNLDFKNITSDFLEEFREFLKTENPDIRETSVNAYLMRLREIVLLALKKKFITADPFEEFDFDEVKESDKDDIALTKEERNILVRWTKPDGFPLPELSPRLERCRRWFVIGCFTGLRAKDLRTLTPERHIRNGVFKVPTSKKGKSFELPVSVVIQRIIKSGWPKPISSQQMNADIKQVCELAQLNETGVYAPDLDLPVWKCVTAHTSRRTFATVALHEDKVPVETVMRWLGHTDSKTTWGYARPRRKALNNVFAELDKENI